MNLVRQFLYGLWFYFSIGVWGVGGLPLGLSSRHGALKVMTSWCASQRWALRLICGVTVEIRGAERIPDGGCLIAMKHQSTFDVVAPFLFLPDPAFTPKDELRKAPIFGFYVVRSKMIMLDRAGGAKTMRLLLSESKAAVKDGRQVLIFPEGTRQPVGAPPDYKPGVAGLYRSIDAPCIPVALNTGLVWPGSRFPSKPGRIIFEILPAIEPGLDRETFLQRLQDAIEPATERLVAEARTSGGA